MAPKNKKSKGRNHSNRRSIESDAHFTPLATPSLPPAPEANDRDDLRSLRMTTISSHADQLDPSASTEWLCFTATQRSIAEPGFPKPVPKPAHAPAYEVRSTADMGLGVFATRDIKVGEIVLVERPLLVVPANISTLGGLSSDSLIREQAVQSMMDEWEGIFTILVDRMSPENKALLMDLANSYTEDGSGAIFGIIRTNGFHADELGEDPSGVLEDIFYGYSVVGRTGSRFNHSCVPNLVRSFDIPSFTLVFTASRDIDAGAQMFVQYCSVEAGVAARQTDLSRYGVICQCRACDNVVPERDQFRDEFCQRAREHFEKGLAWENPSTPIDSADFRALLEFQCTAIEEGLDTNMFYVQILTTLMSVYKRLGLMRKADELYALASKISAICGISV